MKTTFYIVLFLIVSPKVLGQLIVIDQALVSTDTELNFNSTKNRGIEHDGFTYYVEDDLQNILVIKDKTFDWQTNIITVCGKPKVGDSKIRYMKLEDNKLIIIFGKHSFAEVDLKNKITLCKGSD